MSDFPPDDQQIEPTQEELDLEAQFAPAGDTPSPEASDAGADDAPPEAPAPASTRFDLAGVEVDQREAEAMRDMYRYLVNNEQALRDIDAYMRGEATIAPRKQQAPPPPKEDDLEGVDPAIRARFDEMEEMRRRLESIESSRGEQERAVATTAVGKGMELFQARYGLTDEDMTQLEKEATALAILPQIAQQTGDMIAAVERTLDIAYWQNPTYRDREISRQKEADSQDRKRQNKAGALAGGSGSNPRANQQFDTSTKDGREQATVEAFRAAMNGTN